MPSSPGPVADVSDRTAFADLSAVLWDARELLEQLLYNAAAQHWFYAYGESRWRTRAAQELRLAVSQLRITEVLRAAESEELCRRLGLPNDTTLRAIAAVAPEPWQTLLSDHRRALRGLLDEIDLATAQVAATLVEYLD